MDIGSKVTYMPRMVQMLIALTVILALGGIVTGIGPAIDGEVFGYTRIALGLVGITGVALMLLGSDNGGTGLKVILLWAAIQSIFYAQDPDGNYNRQLVDGLLGASSSTTINGEITQFEAIGLNLVGLVMLGLAYNCRNKLPRRHTSVATA